MGLSLKPATGNRLPFVSPVPAAIGSLAAEGSSAVLTDRGQAPEQGPRRNRARINRAPVLDRSRIAELAGELRPRTRFHEFVNLFLVLLPHRVDGVISAVDGEDREAACAAVLSLASAAAMAGARRLELVACLIDADLRAGRVNRARETSRRLGDDAAELASALSPLLAAT